MEGEAMKLKDNESVQEFLKQILEGVRLKEAHEEIRQEYLSQIEEAVDLKIQSGLTRAQAIDKTLTEMGSAQEISHELQRVHRPTFDFVLIAPPILLSAFGIFCLSQLGYAGRQSLWAALGLAAGAALYFTKPAKIIRFSPMLYGLSVLLLLVARLLGVSFYGRTYLPLGPIHIASTDLSLILFLVAITGLIHYKSKNRYLEKSIVPLAAAPLLYFAATQAFTDAGLYFVGVLSVFIAVKSPAVRTLSFAALGSVLPWACDSNLFLSKAEWMKGLTTAAHTDFIFSRLQTLSPFLAKFSLLLFGLFVVRSFMASKEIKNRFGSALVTGLAVMFTAATVWSLAADLGSAPMPRAGLNVPFLSYGGTLIVANLALVGLILGAVRRKSLTLI